MNANPLISFCRRVLISLSLLASSSFAVHAQTSESADVFVKKFSTQILAAIKTDKEIQRGDSRKVLDLVNRDILPHINFEHTTALAVGRHWPRATPEQQQRLADEFRQLLVFTYAGALEQVQDQHVQMRPFRASPTDTDVIVRTLIVGGRGEPIQLDYRVEKTAAGWKIYDLNILGAWLVENYRTQFANEISQNGIDGLIKKLAEMNRNLDKTALSKK